MGEHIHRWLTVIAVSVAVIAFVGWRSLKSGDVPGTGVGTAAPPNPQLAPLMPYTKPLADSIGVLRLSRDNIVLPRDPFGQVAPQVTQVTQADQPRSAARVVQSSDGQIALRVTATMIAGTRRAAVINDMLLYVGDPVPGGGKLTSVERDRVVVTDPKGASHTVAVKEGDD